MSHPDTSDDDPPAPGGMAVSSLARRAGAGGLNSRWAFVSLVTLIYWLGPQSIRLFYPLELQELGASDFTIGVGVGVGSIAGLLLAVPSGYFLDSINSQRFLIFTTCGLAVTTGCFALVQSVITMIGLMFLQGMFQMWVWLALQSMITRVGSGPRSLRQLSMFSLAWGIGLAAGPSVAAWVYGTWGFDVLSLTCGLFVLAGTVSALFLPHALRQVRSADVGQEVAGDEAQPGVGIVAALRRSFHDPVVIAVMVSSFVNLFVQSLRLSFYPVFLERGDVSVNMIGLLLSAIGASSLVIRVFLPTVVRRYGQVKPLLVSTWIAIVGVSMTPLSYNLVFLFVGALMIGAGLGANPPITVNLLAESGGRDNGIAVALRMVANRTAQVVQPLLFGGLAALAGLAMAFPVSGVLLGGAAVWMARRLKNID